MDRTTKILLAIMGMALWFIALNPWLRPPMVQARSASLDDTVREIARSVDRIERGWCSNKKIC